MTTSQSDAVVLFGATGDLAHKKIFPAPHAVVEHGRLQIPVIGVAKAGWNLDQLRLRAREWLSRSMIAVEAPGWRGATKAHTVGM